MSRLLAVAFVLVAVGGLAALSGVPWAAEPSSAAVIRLAWRARGERVQRCRRRSADELARLPVHMRQEEVCERGIIPYRLRVTINDSLTVNELVRAGGAESDRPLFVFDELPLPPGTYRLSISFDREEDPDHKKAGSADEESDRRETDVLRQTPPHLTLDSVVTLQPRTIVLVTYDDEGRALRLLAGPQFAP